METKTIRAAIAAAFTIAASAAIPMAAGAAEVSPDGSATNAPSVDPNNLWGPSPLNHPSNRRNIIDV